MRLVQDLLFVSTLSFEIPADVAGRCYSTSRSMEQVMQKACAHVGIDLVDYERGTVQWSGAVATVKLVSRSEIWQG